jgi:formylglycine-generating enzyme required for sulfatase activity
VRESGAVEGEGGEPSGGTWRQDVRCADIDALKSFVVRSRRVLKLGPLGLLAFVALAPLAGVATAKPPPTTSTEDDGAEDDDNPYASASVSAPAPRPVASALRTIVPQKDGMLLLPGGHFTMGSADKSTPPNEHPPHAVTVAPFWIDRTEVTVGAYRACVESHACARPEKSSATCTFGMDDPELPISCVTWQDADSYCLSAKKRLPTEPEWEFAARGLHGGRYPWGGSGSSCGLAVTLLREATGKSCAKGRPTRVGTHPMGASVWGVLDLSGNVEEWTADWYTETYAGTSPRAGASHTLRGGGWLSSPSGARTTSRDWASAVEAGPNVGFRCARGEE